MDRGLKFRIKELEGLYYVRKKRGADQLGGYLTADLHLCFRIYAKSRFSNDTAQGLRLIFDDK